MAAAVQAAGYRVPTRTVHQTAEALRALQALRPAVARVRRGPPGASVEVKMPRPRHRLCWR